jgi:hypothetical protein
MSFANDPQFVAWKNSHKHVDTPIGTIFIISFNEPLPPVGRRLTKAEGITHMNQIKSILSEWSIVAFDQGAVTGSGYHHELKETVGSECGEGFVVINIK